MIKFKKKIFSYILIVICLCFGLMQASFAATNIIGDINFSLASDSANVFVGDEFNISVDISGALNDRGIFVITSGVFYDDNAFEPVFQNGKIAQIGEIIPMTGVNYLTSATAYGEGKRYVSTNYGLNDATTIKRTGRFTTIRFKVKPTAVKGAYDFGFYTTGVVNQVLSNGSVNVYNAVLNGTRVNVAANIDVINIPATAAAGETVTISGSSRYTPVSIVITDRDGAEIFSNLSVEVVNSNFSQSYTFSSSAVSGDYTVHISDGLSTVQYTIAVTGVTPTAPPTNPPTGGGGGPGPTAAPNPTQAPVMLHHTPYLTGYSDGTFQPANKVSRQETAVMLYRILPKESQRTAPPNIGVLFPDVDNNSWSFDAIYTLNTLGYITGYEDGTFKPQKEISRAEFCAIIARYKNIQPKYEERFGDVLSDYWAYGFISALSDMGLVTGYPGNEFLPANPLTRAEAVTIINRMLGRFLVLESIPEDIALPDVSRDYWAFSQICEAAIEHRSTVIEGMEYWVR